MVWNGCFFEPVWWQIATFCCAALVDVAPGVAVEVDCSGGGVVVGTLIDVPGFVEVATVVVTGIVVVTVTVETVPVVVVVVMVTVVVGLTFCAEAPSLAEPAVTCASPTPAAAAKARPTAVATTTRERRLTRGNRLGMVGIPSSGTYTYGSAVPGGGGNLRRASGSVLGSGLNRRDDRPAVALEEEIDHALAPGQADAAA